MAGVPPKSGEAYTFYFSVTSQADTNIFQANPTIAAGDFQYSNDEGATFNNPGTLPVVVAGNNKVIQAVLTGAEMTPTAGDKILWQGSDAVGAEWQDYSREITVTVRNVDDLSTQAQILSDATPFAGANIANLDAAISTRATQAQILSDATPFAGANIDAAISTRSTLTAAQVWANPIRTLTSFGTLIADIWNNPTRTLTSIGPTLLQSIWTYTVRTLTAYLATGVVGESLGDMDQLPAFYPGTTVAFTITCTIDGVVQDITGDTVAMYVKNARLDPDSAAVIAKQADVVTQGANGIAMFELTPTDTDPAVGGTNYFMDIVWDLAGGREYVIHEQTWLAEERVSD